MSKQDINIIQTGLKKRYLNDIYYYVIKSSWPTFLIVSALVYLLINLFFALLYYYSPAEILNAKPDSLWDAFIFSFQTSSTLGFGRLLPKSNLAHVIVILDTMMGIFYVAIMTGLAFSKFAKPSAKIIFSDKIILSTFDNIPTLMFRLANGRSTHIVDASLNVAVLLPYESKEGIKMRRFFKLPLIGNNNPTFSLSWTAMHQITKDSPLYNLNIEDYHLKKIIIFVSFTGIEDVLSQTIHSNHRFIHSQIIEAKNFADIMSQSEDHSTYTIDFNKFNDIV